MVAPCSKNFLSNPFPEDSTRESFPDGMFIESLRFHFKDVSSANGIRVVSSNILTSSCEIKILIFKSLLLELAKKLIEP